MGAAGLCAHLHAGPALCAHRCLGRRRGRHGDDGAGAIRLIGLGGWRWAQPPAARPPAAAQQSPGTTRWSSPSPAHPPSMAGPIPKNLRSARH